MVLILGVAPDDAPVAIADDELSKRHQFPEEGLPGLWGAFEEEHLGEDIAEDLGVFFLQSVQIGDRVFCQPYPCRWLRSHQYVLESVQAGVDLGFEFGPVDAEVFHRLIKICAEAAIGGEAGHDQSGVSEGIAILAKFIKFPSGDDGSDGFAMAGENYVIAGLGRGHEPGDTCLASFSDRQIRHATILARKLCSSKVCNGLPAASSSPPADAVSAGVARSRPIKNAWKGPAGCSAMREGKTTELPAPTTCQFL